MSDPLAECSGVSEGELAEVLALLAGTDIVELDLAFGASRLTLRRPPSASSPLAPTPTPAIQDSPSLAIASPLVGVFHPSVSAPPAIRKDVPSILFLGRFDPRNGLTTLIDSFRKVKGKGRPAQLVVVGDGPLREHYYKQARGDDDITFVGAVLEGRPSYYAHSSIYACPTTKASFGITLLESMACETPIICSDILGFQDVVVNGREALMIPCGDRPALADALVQLLDDEGLRIQLGTTGRYESMKYSWPRVTSQVLDVYHNVMGRVAVQV